MIENNVSIDMVLEKLQARYESHYKGLFNAYFVNLKFTTILTYYSGMCSIVTEFISLPGYSVQTSMLFMVDADKNELFTLEADVVDKVIEKGILEKYKHFFCINQSLCSYNLNRKVIIKNANFKEPALSIKLEKEAIILEMNSHYINNIEETDRDFAYVLDSMSKYFSI